MTVEDESIAPPSSGGNTVVTHAEREATAIPSPATLGAEGEAPYTTFTTREKRWIIAMASFASFFSPLSSSIYFPALSTIAHDLNVSDSKVNLTVTTYLVRHVPAPNRTRT